VLSVGMEIQTVFRYYLYHLVKYSVDCSSSLYNKHSPEHMLIGQYYWPFFIASDSRHIKLKQKKCHVFYPHVNTFLHIYR